MDQVIQSEGLWWVTRPVLVAHAGSPGFSRAVGQQKQQQEGVEVDEDGDQAEAATWRFPDQGLTGTVPSSSISLALWQMKTTRKQRDRPILMHFWSAEGPDPRRVRGHGQTLPLPCHLWRQKAFLQRQPPLRALNARTAAGVQLCLLSLLPSPIPLLLCLPEICLLFIAPFIILLTGLE